MRIRPLLLAAVLLYAGVLAGCGSDTGNLTWHDGTRDVLNFRTGRPVDAPWLDIRRGRVVHEHGVLHAWIELVAPPHDARIGFLIVFERQCTRPDVFDIRVSHTGSVEAKLQQAGRDGAFYRRPVRAWLRGTRLRVQAPLPGDAHIGVWVAAAAERPLNARATADALSPPPIFFVPDLRCTKKQQENFSENPSWLDGFVGFV